MKFQNISTLWGLILTNLLRFFSRNKKSTIEFRFLKSRLIKLPTLYISAVIFSTLPTYEVNFLSFQTILMKKYMVAILIHNKNSKLDSRLFENFGIGKSIVRQIKNSTVWIVRIFGKWKRRPQKISKYLYMYWLWVHFP